MKLKKENGSAITVIIVLIIILIFAMMIVGTILFFMMKNNSNKGPERVSFEESDTKNNESRDDDEDEDDNEIENNEMYNNEIKGNEVSTNEIQNNITTDVGVDIIDSNVGTIYITANDFNSNIKGVKQYIVKESIIKNHKVKLHEYLAIYSKDSKLYDVKIIYTESSEKIYEGDTAIKLTFNNTVKSVPDEYILGSLAISKGVQKIENIKQTLDPQKFIVNYNNNNYTIINTITNGIGNINVTKSTEDEIKTIKNT